MGKGSLLALRGWVRPLRGRGDLGRGSGGGASAGARGRRAPAIGFGRSAAADTRHLFGAKRRWILPAHVATPLRRGAVRDTTPRATQRVIAAERRPRTSPHTTQRVVAAERRPRTSPHTTQRFFAAERRSMTSPHTTQRLLRRGAAADNSRGRAEARERPARPPVAQTKSLRPRQRPHASPNALPTGPLGQTLPGNAQYAQTPTWTLVNSFTTCKIVLDRPFS